MDDPSETTEPKTSRLTLPALHALLEALRGDVSQLADRVEHLRESAAGRLDGLDERVTAVAQRAEVIANGLDGAYTRLGVLEGHPKPHDPAPSVPSATTLSDWPEGAAVRYVGAREIRIPRPGATNGAMDLVRHRDVLRGPAGAWLRDHHPDLVEPYPRPKA